MTSPSASFDVVVAGSGIAGSCLAGVPARAGQTCWGSRRSRVSASGAGAKARGRTALLRRSRWGSETFSNGRERWISSGAVVTTNGRRRSRTCGPRTRSMPAPKSGSRTRRSRQRPSGGRRNRTRLRCALRRRAGLRATAVRKSHCTRREGGDVRGPSGRPRGRKAVNGAPLDGRRIGRGRGAPPARRRSGLRRLHRRPGYRHRSGNTRVCRQLVRRRAGPHPARPRDDLRTRPAKWGRPNGRDLSGNCRRAHASRRAATGMSGRAGWVLPEQRSVGNARCRHRRGVGGRRGRRSRSRPGSRHSHALP